jgi:hypothetical protein
VSSRFAAAFLALSLAGGGCFMSPPVAAAPCAAQFSTARCDAIMVWIVGELGIQPDQIGSIAIVPPAPEPPGMIGRGTSVLLRVGFVDGTTREMTMLCAGTAGNYLPQCMADPRIEFLIPGSEGYRDFPENATPVPAIDPAAEAAAVPLALPRVDVPIDRTGGQRFVLGQAGLANGILREVKSTLAEPWPASVFILGSIRMEIRPLGGGDPIGNIYEHGWRPGVETVEVSIVFNAAILRPGAHLTLLDVVVR